MPVANLNDVLSGIAVNVAPPAADLCTCRCLCNGPPTNMSLFYCTATRGEHPTMRHGRAHPLNSGKWLVYQLREAGLELLGSHVGQQMWLCQFSESGTMTAGPEMK